MVYNVSYYQYYFKYATLFWLLCCAHATTIASNISYIMLSDQMARKAQLDITSNNVANAETIGYEADNLVFERFDVKQNKSRSTSFVRVAGIYRLKDNSALKNTNRPLDLAINGEGYFKILTLDGARDTLNGNVSINNGSVLVNSQGFPFASATGQPILLPIDTKDIQITRDGTIYVDGEAIDMIGVFSFIDSSPLIKEGNNLYKSQGRDILLDNPSVISGSLKDSNVNSVKAMTDMVELQRAIGASNSLMSSITELESKIMNKVLK